MGVFERRAGGLRTLVAVRAGVGEGKAGSTPRPVHVNDRTEADGSREWDAFLFGVPRVRMICKIR